VPKNLTIARFRPNIVVGGGSAHQEDNWLKFKIGTEIFIGNSLCHRCTLTNVDPETGIASGTTLKDLMKTRRIDPGFKLDPCMGINASHIKTGATLTPGLEIAVLETGAHDQRGVWNRGVFPQAHSDTAVDTRSSAV